MALHGPTKLELTTTSAMRTYGIASAHMYMHFRCAYAHTTICLVVTMQVHQRPRERKAGQA